MKAWLIFKDDESYGQNFIEAHKSKESAEKRVKWLNAHKDALDKVTGDFYCNGETLKEDKK